MEQLGTQEVIEHETSTEIVFSDDKIRLVRYMPPYLNALQIGTAYKGDIESVGFSVSGKELTNNGEGSLYYVENNPDQTDPSEPDPARVFLYSKAPINSPAEIIARIESELKGRHRLPAALQPGRNSLIICLDPITGNKIKHGMADATHRDTDRMAILLEAITQNEKSHNTTVVLDSPLMLMPPNMYSLDVMATPDSKKIINALSTVTGEKLSRLLATLEIHNIDDEARTEDNYLQSVLKNIAAVLDCNELAEIAKDKDKLAAWYTEELLSLGARNHTWTDPLSANGDKFSIEAAPSAAGATTSIDADGKILDPNSFMYDKEYTPEQTSFMNAIKATLDMIGPEGLMRAGILCAVKDTAGGNHIRLMIGENHPDILQVIEKGNLPLDTLYELDLKMSVDFPEYLQRLRAAKEKGDRSYFYITGLPFKLEVAKYKGETKKTHGDYLPGEPEQADIEKNEELMKKFITAHTLINGEKSVLLIP